MGKLKCRVWCLSLLVLGTVFLAGAASEESLGSEETSLRKQALALNEVTGTEPMSGELKRLLSNPAATKKLLAVAAKMVKEEPQPFNRNATLLLAMAAENAREVDIGATFYRLNAKQSLALFSERGIAQAYVGLIELYANNQRYADSEKVCREFLSIEGEEDEAIDRLKPLVMRRMILAVAKQGASERALRMVDQLIKVDPRNFLHRALRAQVLREAENYDEAAKVYLDVIDRIERDKRFEQEEKQEYIDEYRYSLAGIYIDAGNIDKAAEQLKILLDREPNNPLYNNDLGYIWADKGIHLEQAEKLIRRAIEEDQKIRKRANAEEMENAAYLDSLGWVLFKQGKVKEAKPHLLAAVKLKEGQSIEIYDHLADVHLALNEKDEAIAVLKKGLEIAGSTKRDLKRKIEVEKKLKELEGK